MYQPHPVFESPEDSARLWRYMDLSKLIDLLHRKSLFFSRADRLGDPWEGGTSYVNVNQRLEFLRGVNPDLPHLIDSDPYRNSIRDIRKFIYISCWHENPVESAAMWKLYLKSDEGIAVQTTVTRLKNCFQNTDKQVFIGKVRYFNPMTDVLPGYNLLEKFLFKLHHYKHEVETRAVLLDVSALTSKQPIPEYGVHIPAELGHSD